MMIDHLCPFCNVYETSGEGEPCAKCYGIGFRKGQDPEPVRIAFQLQFLHDMRLFIAQLADDAGEGGA